MKEHELENIEDMGCRRCGCFLLWEECDQCDEGFEGHECGEDCCACAEPEDNVPCAACDGQGGWLQCQNSYEWCQEHPLPGHEEMSRTC